MDKIDERKLKPEFPFMKNEITPNIISIGPKPEIVEKLMFGRSESAKSFMEADLDKLRSSIKVEQIKAKFQILGTDHMLEAEKDFRTGDSDIKSTLPKTVKIEEMRIPIHPELALNAAMKKLNQRSNR